jgi:high-affinity iron transporter
VVGLVAVVMLASMVFWMRKASRSIKAELQGSIDRAFDGGHASTFALIGMIFLAVAREGLESVFFLLAVFQQSEGAQAPLGALLGIIVAAAIGYGIYAGGIKLNLRKFFRWTGVFILIVAAGILAGTVRALHEAGLWNGLQAVVFDMSGILPVDSPLGTVFAGILGYEDTPTVGEVAVYIIFLAVCLRLFLKPNQTQARLPAGATPTRT